MNWRVGVGLGLLVLAFGAGWLLHGWKSDSEALAIDRAVQATQATTAAAIAKIEVKNTVINQKVVEHTYHDPVYQECRHTPEAYQQILDLFKEP